jgi:hypothetical protein
MYVIIYVMNEVEENIFMAKYRVGFTTEPTTITDGLGVKEYLYESEMSIRSNLEFIDEIDDNGEFVRSIYYYRNGLLVDYRTIK